MRTKPCLCGGTLTHYTGKDGGRLSEFIVIRDRGAVVNGGMVHTTEIRPSGAMWGCNQCEHCEAV